MSDNYIIRPYRHNASDLESLGQLETDCAQGVGMRFCYPRHPPRFEKFIETVALLAEERMSGKIVAATCGTIRTVLFQTPQRFEKVALLHTVRVLPDHRRANLASVLSAELEKMLIERGVTFIYAAASTTNVPSQSLLKKLNYKYMFDAPCLGINIGHVRKLLPSLDELSQQGFALRAYQPPHSEPVLRERFCQDFMFPAEEYPVNGIVYAAQFQEAKLNIVVANVPDVWTIISVPFRVKLKSFLFGFLNWFFPNLFEKPLPIKEPWRIRVVCPMWTENLTKLEQFEPLFNAALALMCEDLNGKADVLNIYAKQSYSGLSPEYVEIVSKSRYISPTVLKTLGCLVVAKSLLPDAKEAESMEKYALEQPFWFIDGKEL